MMLKHLFEPANVTVKKNAENARKRAKVIVTWLSGAATRHAGAIHEVWDGAYVGIEQFWGGLFDERPATLNGVWGALVFVFLPTQSVSRLVQSADSSSGRSPSERRSCLRFRVGKRAVTAI